MSDIKLTTIKKTIRKGELLSTECPSREILGHVTSKWSVLIFLVLATETHRFSALKRKVGGISERMLTRSLQSLEKDGFVKRKSFPVVPPHVEYSLTPLGVEVSEKVISLAYWIENNMTRIINSSDVKH